MESLADAVSGSFDIKTRRRGEEYYHSGRVSLTVCKAGHALAYVRGSEEYEVALTVDGSSLQVSCDCPAYLTRGLCKHIWATILAVGGKLATFLPQGVRRLSQLTEVGLEDVEDEEEPDEGYEDRGPPPYRPVFSGKPPLPAYPYGDFARPRGQNWRDVLGHLAPAPAHAPYANEKWPEQEELAYVAEPRRDHAAGLLVRILSRRRKRNGQWGKAKPRAVSRRHVPVLRDPVDRQIVGMLLGGSPEYGYYEYGGGQKAFGLDESLLELLLPPLCSSGRFSLSIDPDVTVPLRMENGSPWELVVQVVQRGGKGYGLAGYLASGQHRRELSEAAVLLGSFVLFKDGGVCSARLPNRVDWAGVLMDRPDLVVPRRAGGELIEMLASLPEMPRLELPEELQYQRVQVHPRPHLQVRRAKNSFSELEIDAGFLYDSVYIPADPPAAATCDSDGRRLLMRDVAAERLAVQRLVELGATAPRWQGQKATLAPKKLPAMVKTLLEEGWQVEAEGAIYRRPGSCSVSVTSGIDWFELRGDVDYGGAVARLPQLLEALRKKQAYVVLDDGSRGLLPEEWLAKLDLVGRMGRLEEDHVRYSICQVGVLDAMLAELPQTNWDQAACRIRQEVQASGAVEPADAPDGFAGTLRPYQREGLGWLHFLRKTGLGGCLADDMGLGKTVQVLALLEQRRQQRQADAAGVRDAPSLVVVPRSLIFNWIEEAGRFTPRMRVLAHAGLERQKESTSHLRDYDLILTTYGTLRRDIGFLKDVTFDYVILDEAQAIKNDATVSAKAARLLQGGHRLCLTGTPIENHLGELWSQIEFLNPGMLGASSVLGKTRDGRDLDETSRRLLARALRPLILRRLKEQVAKDLPARTEQTLHCHLKAEQRRLYDELKNHYRAALLGRVSKVGLGKSKIQVLEALLRLRQAACHPALIDPGCANESSAKLDTLLAQLAEVQESGHKALVFSQFTSFLSIVRSRLDAQGVVYEYLDGQTRKRQERVARFQNDAGCRLFLISLKAGGLGLNLTAADYVFLLDPWWNPAVEAQAIDRAHRIGQDRHVFAYRLIASDTVEERVLALQQTKRDLAEMIIGQDGNLLRDLKVEDLELLLS